MEIIWVLSEEIFDTLTSEIVFDLLRIKSGRMKVAKF